MVPEARDIVILRQRIDRKELARLVDRFFVDMVKYVADVHRGLIAIGGELHADAEQVLLEDGSRQADLWGANYFPGRGKSSCIEFTSLINLRPASGNRSMHVEDERLRTRIRELTASLIGEGEAL